VTRSVRKLERHLAERRIRELLRGALVREPGRAGGLPKLHELRSWRASFSGPVYNNANLFGATIYDKGGWVQHMLRHVVGDTNFFNAMRDWYANNADGVGNTALYQATQEMRYGATLDVFFQQWVYGTGQPATSTGGPRRSRERHVS
jgi:hypothetical protein